MPLFPPPLTQPAIICDDAAMFGGAGVTITLPGPGTLILLAFELQAQTLIHQMRWRMGATTTGHTNMAIYTAAGNLVSGSDTGAIANVANTLQTQAYGTDVVLVPGQYFLALACENSTDTYEGVSGVSSRTGTSRWRGSTNALAAGAMPSTLGALSTVIGVVLGIAAIPTGSLIG